MGSKQDIEVRYLLGEEKESKAQNNLLIFLIIILDLVIIFFSLFSFCVVQGDSMLDNLIDKEIVLLLKSPSSVKRGDIVTIENVSESSIIKRVIGLGGDKIVFKIHHNNPDYVQLYLNTGDGYKLMDEEYLKESMRKSSFSTMKMFINGNYRLAPSDAKPFLFDNYAIEVKKDEFFFMGDNRNISKDSRFYGCRKIKKISGKMLFKIKEK